MGAIKNVQGALRDLLLPRAPGGEWRYALVRRAGCTRRDRPMELKENWRRFTG